MSRHHSMDINNATKYGIEEAFLIHHMEHWISINKSSKRHFHEGRTWMYQSLDDIAANFPYLNKSKVFDILEKLCLGKHRKSKSETLDFEPVLVKGNFNKNNYDKTTWYAFADESKWDLGNAKQDVGKSQNRDCDVPTPIPDTKPYSKPEKESKPKKAPRVSVATAISLNSSTKKFEGISEEDINRWRETFPAVNVLKELNECLLWALNNPRKNYRKSIDTWMRNVSKSHTEPFKQEIEASIPGTAEECVFNKRIGDGWEQEIQKRPGSQTHTVHSSPSKITFVLSEDTYSVEYSINTKEFLKKCEKGIRKLRLPTPKMSN